MESTKHNIHKTVHNSDETNHRSTPARIESVNKDEDKLINPLKHINELRALDVYSADDVRQSIKSALAGKMFYKCHEGLQLPKMKQTGFKPTVKGNSKTGRQTFKHDKTKQLTIDNKKQIEGSRKRKRGGAIASGSFKNPKRFKRDHMYMNKEPYKRRKNSQTEDSESGVSI